MLTDWSNNNQIGKNSKVDINLEKQVIDPDS